MSDSNPNEKPRSLSPTSFKAVVAEVASRASDPPTQADVKITSLHTRLAVDIAGVLALLAIVITRSAPELNSWCVGGIMAICGVAQALRGMGKNGSAVLLVGSAVPVVVKALLGRSVMLLPLAFLVGCGASVSGVVDTMRTELNDKGYAVVEVTCKADPGQRCTDVRKAYEVAQASVEAAYDALDVYGAVAPEFKAAMLKAKNDYAEINRVATR